MFRGMDYRLVNANNDNELLWIGLKDYVWWEGLSCVQRFENFVGNGCF